MIVLLTSSTGKTSLYGTYVGRRKRRCGIPDGTAYLKT